MCHIANDTNWYYLSLTVWFIDSSNLTATKWITKEQMFVSPLLLSHVSASNVITVRQCGHKWKS